MSVVNLVIEPDRVLIGVDTIAGYMEGATNIMSEGDRQGRHSCKLSALPQIDTAVTHRGDGMLTAIALLNLQLAAPRDFDHAVQLMPGIIEQAFVYAMAQRRQQTSIDVFPGAEIVLVGWSSVQARFSAVRWRRYQTDPSFAQEPIEGRLLQPEIDRISPVETPDTDSRMEALMRKQIAWAQQEHPQLACGGRLLMAEMKRGSITIRTIAHIS